MDLIYTDKRRQDVGVLNDYTFDLAFGADENDFELTLDAENHCCDANCLLYIENTEYGGIIDGIGVVTGSEQLRYFGRTWQGIFASKIIEPDEGEAYLTVSGDANEIIGDLIERCGLSELFVAPKSPSGLTIESYQFDRYVDAYSGLKKMLEFVNWKLRFSFVGQAVLVSALPAVDYSQGEQFDSAGAEMSIEKRKNNTNHLICLGKGELTDRRVVHLYMDENGVISRTQTFFGLQEMTKTFDCPNAESEEELVKQGMVKFEEYSKADKLQMDLESEEVIYDVGDIVGAEEPITGIVASEKITKKIVTIRQGEVNIQYKVGE